LRIALPVSLALAALAGAASAAPAERWLPIAPRDAGRGAFAMNLNSIRPDAQKGLDDAAVLEVVDARTVWLLDYQVRCGRGYLHPIAKHAVDPKTGKVGEAAPVELVPLMSDATKPVGQGEAWVLEIVCHPSSAGGHVFADRRAVIWTLGR